MQDFYAELNVLGRKVELFVNSFTPRGSGIVKSLVTTVTLRVPQDTRGVPTANWVFSGSAIHNPKDQFDGVYGVQVAYRRAWQEMERMFSSFTKAEWDQLRLARWQVMEGRDRCTQDTQKVLLPPETTSLGSCMAADLIAKYPRIAGEMPPEHHNYYPTVGVLLEDLSERYGFLCDRRVEWRVSEAGFIPMNKRDAFTCDYTAPKVIRWREVVDWEAERDPEAARRAQLLAKYPNDAIVELPNDMNGSFRARNVGVLLADGSEGYAWLYGEEEHKWVIFEKSFVPDNCERVGPRNFESLDAVVRWRDISDWDREKAEHDRQTV
jgi:hypothetical protein